MKYLIIILLLMTACTKQQCDCTTVYQPLIIKPHHFHTDKPWLYIGTDTVLYLNQKVIAVTTCDGYVNNLF